MNMANLKYLLVAMLFLIAAAGCSSDEGEQALHESAFGDMTQSLERAEDVDQLQKDRMNELNSAIEN